MQNLIELTEAENEVLRYIAKGYKIPDIALARYVSVATIKTQIGSILGKFNVKNQTQALAYAYQQGYLTPEVDSNNIIAPYLMGLVPSLTKRGLTPLDCLDAFKEAGYSTQLLDQVFDAFSGVSS